MFRIKFAVLALICGLTGSLVHAQGTAPPKPLRFGWQAATPVTTFWAGFELKTFEDQGLKLELSSFNDNAPELEAVSCGAIGAMSSMEGLRVPSSLPFNSVIARSNWRR